MPDYYSEPFLNLAGLTHKSALIAWGAFYFRVEKNESDFKLVDDDDLKHVHPPRHQTKVSTVNGKRMTVRAIGQLNNEGELVDIARKAPNNTAVTEDLIINLP